MTWLVAGVVGLLVLAAGLNLAAVYCLARWLQCARAIAECDERIRQIDAEIAALDARGEP